MPVSLLPVISALFAVLASVFIAPIAGHFDRHYVAVVHDLLHDRGD
ncbi:hypothetical protein B194_2658 [Serratia plymuthica A30]|nr:hypothetical protein B194_2658 [Serratia plymuthica A30]